MSWYSTGADAAEKLTASSGGRRRANFYVQDGESARIRFLKPAAESFNYKRCFVKWAKGEKMLTSPDTTPDPFVERGLPLQASFAWPIIDRRVIEFSDQTTGEKKKIGPRVLYFADGSRTLKQLKAFEREMLNAVNEEREEDGKDALTLDEFNLTHYDLKVSKPKGAPWNFVQMRPKELSDKDNELVEKANLDLNGHDWLANILKPLPLEELKSILGSSDEEEESSEDETYSYSDDEEDDTVSFDD